MLDSSVPSFRLVELSILLNNIKKDCLQKRDEDENAVALPLLTTNTPQIPFSS